MCFPVILSCSRLTADDARNKCEVQIVSVTVCEQHVAFDVPN